MRKIRNNKEGRNGNPFLSLLTLLVVVLSGLFLMSTQTEAAAPFETWNSVSPPLTADPIKGIIYGDGKLVAVGGSKIFTSTDGVNGLSWATADFGSGNFNAVTYGKSMFVAVGDGPNNLYTSLDGYTWTLRVSGTTANLKGVAYGNGKFVAVGDDGSGTGVIASSSDGISWGTTTLSGSTWTLTAITYDANTFVAVGKFNFGGAFPTAASLVSSDGNPPWTVNQMYPSIPFPYAPAAVTYFFNYFVAVAPPGTMYYSANGQNWIRKSTSYNLRGIASFYLVAVAVGDGGTLVTFSDPTDPTTWTPQDSRTTNNLSGVTFGDDTRFFVVGAGTVLYSGPFGFDLAVAKPGTGTGTVRSLPPGINCGTDCDEHYDAGTVVTLTAAPDTGSYFAGWSEDCVSQALTCKVTMNAAKNVKANFTTTPPAVTTWAKTYGGSIDDQPFSVQQTSDGGYIVAGGTMSFGAGNGDIWVLKLTSDGSLTGPNAWQKTYGGTNIDIAFSVQQTSDGGYIVAGQTNSFGTGKDNLWVLKLTSDGSLSGANAWQKTYGPLSASGHDVVPSFIQQTSDGGYIVAGATKSFGGGDYDFWVLKLNSDGTVAWQKTYGGANFEEPASVQQTSDGGYIVAGGTSNAAGTGDFWVLKLDADGGVAWQKTYGGSGLDYASSIQQTTDGGYIVAGYTNSFGAGNTDFLVLKLNSDGSLTGPNAWQKTYGGANFEWSLLMSVQQTSDGGYILAGGTMSFGAGNGDIWVLKLNSDGSLTGPNAWQKTYGGANFEEAASVQQTSDGGYILAGPTLSFGVGNPDHSDLLVLKLDSNGNIDGCPGGLIGTSAPVVVGTPAVTITSPTPTIATSTATVTDTSITPGTTTVTPGEVCTGIPPCTYSISPTTEYYPTGGGSGSVSVTAPPGCNWTAVSNASPWVILTSGASGTGNGTVNYSVTVNQDLAVRTGTMTIAGQTLTITQYYLNSDTDGDSLPDDWEIAYFGNLSQGAFDDPDGDGLTNFQEYQLGTNPNQANGPYTITVFPLPTNGAILCDPTTVNYAGGSTCDITPNTGYHIDSVVVDSIIVGEPPNYPFEIVTANHTISATFVMNPPGPTITASFAPGSTIFPSGSVPVPYDGSQTFTIGTVQPGVIVGDVIVDNVGQGPLSTYTFDHVVADHTITVVVGSGDPPTGSGTVPDSDHDGVDDAIDNCPNNNPNPIVASWTDIYGGVHTNSQKDKDLDGYGDECDTCPDVYNPDQKLTVWYKDFDDDGYSDGISYPSCRRPKFCSTDPNLSLGPCTPSEAGAPCPSGCAGPWVETINGGFAFKSIGEKVCSNARGTSCTNDSNCLIGSIQGTCVTALKSTSGDTDDTNANINPGVPVTNPISFAMNAPDGWLPTYGGADVTVTATVTGGTLNGLTVLRVTRNIGKYTNDPTQGVCATAPPVTGHITGTACINNAGCTAGTCVDPDPDFNYTITGNQITLTSLDFGGSITIHATATLSGGGTVTNDFTLPKDSLGTGLPGPRLPDSWQMTKFGVLGVSPTADADGDGLTNFQEYRGFMWGDLIPYSGTGYCSITKTSCSKNSDCTVIAGCTVDTCDTCIAYATPTYVPARDSNGNPIIAHFRTDPTKKDLFVKFSNNYDANHPFAIGTAFKNAGVDVHAVPCMISGSSCNTPGPLEYTGQPILVVYANNNKTGAYSDSGSGLKSPGHSNDGRIAQRTTGVRNWEWATKGFCQPNNPFPITYQKALDNYFNQKPYTDGGTCTSASCYGSTATYNTTQSRVLDPIGKVEDRNDDGTNTKTSNPTVWDTGSSGGPWRSDRVVSGSFNQVLTAFDIDNNGLVELPLASDPGNIDRTHEYTKAHVLKHTITHELGHAVGMNHNYRSKCLMYNWSSDWSRDDYFSDIARGQMNIHNP